MKVMIYTKIDMGVLFIATGSETLRSINSLPRIK